MWNLSQRRALCCAFAAVIVASAGAAQAVPRRTLQAFASEQEISALFGRWAEEARSRRDAERRSAPATGMGQMFAAPAAKLAAAEAAADSITNVQHAGSR
jgi:hypothetical protein